MSKKVNKILKEVFGIVSDKQSRRNFYMHLCLQIMLDLKDIVAVRQSTYFKSHKNIIYLDVLSSEWNESLFDTIVNKLSDTIWIDNIRLVRIDAQNYDTQYILEITYIEY